MKRDFEISVIIPTFQRWSQLKETLAALEAQTLNKNRFEVIVSDDGSKDHSFQNLLSWKDASPLNLRVITSPNGGPAAARNRGAILATGKWLVFTDDDCVPDPRWLDDYLEYFSDHSSVAGAGGQVLRYRESLISRYMDWCRIMQPSEISNGVALYLVTANAAYRRDIFEVVGGFDDRFRWPGGEDPELSERVRRRGSVLGVIKGAKIRHVHRDTLRGIYRMYWHHGIGYAATDDFAGRGQVYPLSSVLQWAFDVCRGNRRSAKLFWDYPFFVALEGLRVVAFCRGVSAYWKKKNVMAA